MENDKNMIKNPYIINPMIVRMLVKLKEKPRTKTDLARSLNITYACIYQNMKRMRELQLIKEVLVNGNGKREKLFVNYSNPLASELLWFYDRFSGEKQR